MGPKALAISDNGPCGYAAVQSVYRDVETQKMRAIMFCQSGGGLNCRAVASEGGPPR
jgi:hypothetical protein